MNENSNLHKEQIWENDEYICKPLSLAITENLTLLQLGLFTILRNSEVYKYNPKIKIEEIEDVHGFLEGMLGCHEDQKIFTYFIFEKRTKYVIGIIRLISPLIANNKFKFITPMLAESNLLNNVWEIEFYLHPRCWRKGIMKTFVNAITNEIFVQGGKIVFATVMPKNLPSINLLINLKYTLLSSDFDIYDSELGKHIVCFKSPFVETK